MSSATTSIPAEGIDTFVSQIFSLERTCEGDTNCGGSGPEGSASKTAPAEANEECPSSPLSPCRAVTRSTAVSLPRPAFLGPPPLSSIHRAPGPATDVVDPPRSHVRWRQRTSLLCCRGPPAPDPRTRGPPCRIHVAEVRAAVPAAVQAAAPEWPSPSSSESSRLSCLSPSLLGEGRLGPGARPPHLAPPLLGEGEVDGGRRLELVATYRLYLSYIWMNDNVTRDALKIRTGGSHVAIARRPKQGFAMGQRWLAIQ
ncbi:hypothetical protein E2562_028238 [Oryza meyeriana var. granulata]|uniref:Uncharacterized protein n=1 Tax=Oryza meyeriana var. granulata TaxID=110450 RepID=A0A6G1DPI1_9ORYZ|nr:hypothetical protein E2562_028238 [Oryza meyeriana var. granulata]